MLNFATTLGINLPILGKGNSLITPSRFYREPRITFQRNQIAPLNLQVRLIQTSRLLATNSTDRLQYSNRQSEIGWDNWQPIDRSLGRDDFDYKIDRSRYDLADRSSQIDGLENPELDFFTTVLPTEFAEIDPQFDSLSTNSIDVEIPTPTSKDRSTADTIQLQSPGKLQPKPVKLDRKSLESNQIDQIEQPKSAAQSSQVSANIQPPLTPQTSPEIVGENTIVPESSIGLFLDGLALNTVDSSHLEPLPETIIDLNLDSTQSPDSDLTQISRYIVKGASLEENQISSNLASPPELIPDQIVPNLLAPTTINPAISPQVAPLEPEVKTTIIPESAVSPENITPFTVLEQIAKSTEIAPIPESSDRVGADQTAPNSLDLPPVVDPQLPEVATSQLPQLEQISTATENIPSVIPLAIEPVSESISDTLPGDRSDSPIINQPPSTDTAQVSASLDELAIANLDAPALTSALPSEDFSLTTSSLLTDSAQIATLPNQIAPEIQSTQPLNLAEDLSNIDRDLDPASQIEPANPNIPEPLILPADSLLPNLRSDPNSTQIATSNNPIEIEADFQSNQLSNVDTSHFNSLDANVTPALEQISTFADEPKAENQKSVPVSNTQSAETLSDLPLSIDPDLTIASISRFPDSPRSNSDRSLQENTPLELTEIISVEQENITESDDELRADNLLSSLLTDRSVINQPIADSPQSTNQLDRGSTNIVDRSDDLISPTNNPLNNLTNIIQIDQATIELPTINQEESPLQSIDSSEHNLDIIPAPTVGYATGGYVKDANHIDLQSIASSDTVSAMLTPGEFVINAKDAQKNFDLLTHINRGGEPEAALSNTEIQPSIIESPPTSPDISPTSIQRKRNDSLMPSSLQRDIGLQQLSPLTNPGLDTFESSQTESSNSSPTYSSPSMVFRKSMSSPQPQYTGADTPDQWGSIEDLINGGSNNSDPFSFENTSLQQPDLESRSSPSMSPTISPQYTSPIRGFANGGEVTPSDISTTIEPITQTIESPLVNPQSQPANNDPAELEILAREIYHRLRQRLEIERERHGSYSGNLAW